jgi:hypothetical protein
MNDNKILIYFDKIMNFKSFRKRWKMLTYLANRALLVIFPVAINNSLYGC